MRFLLDQGLPRSAAKSLRDAGIDTTHTAECNLAAAKDAEILAHAERQGQCVITLDADFHTILALRRATGPSVVRIRMEGLRSEAIVNIIIAVSGHCTSELANGAMVTVTHDRIRIRRLPV